MICCMYTVRVHCDWLYRMLRCVPAHADLSLPLPWQPTRCIVSRNPYGVHVANQALTSLCELLRACYCCPACPHPPAGTSPFTNVRAHHRLDEEKKARGGASTRAVAQNVTLLRELQVAAQDNRALAGQLAAARAALRELSTR